MTTEFAAALRPGPDAIDLTNDFSGRTAVVTGGASGIGNAIARRPGARGARVAVVDVRADGATAAAADLPVSARPVTTGPDAAADGARRGHGPSMPASPAT